MALQQPVLNQVKQILSKTLWLDSIDELSAVQRLTVDTLQTQMDTCFNELVSHFNSLSNLNQNEENGNMEVKLRRESIHELVSELFNLHHAKKQLVLLRLIQRLVNSRVIEVKYVCEDLLNNLNFSSTSIQASSNTNTGNSGLNSSNNQNMLISLTNTGIQSHNFTLVKKLLNQSEHEETSTYLWCKVLETVRKFIRLHDYKSCRDIFKSLLDVVKRIPHSSSSFPPQPDVDKYLSGPKKPKLLDDQHILNSQSDEVIEDIKLEVLFETINFLLDSNNYFLPRYLAINEIKTVLTFGKDSYHPKFHNLFTTFIESFIPLAHLISVSGRDRLLPVVGSSNLYSLYSFWRFNVANCKFNTSGPLPYFKNISKPHADVFACLLRQNTPQYLILSLMSLHRSVKGRFIVFEEEFGNTLCDTMQLTERNPLNMMENLRIWNNLLNQYISLNQIMHLPGLMSFLSSKLKGKVNELKTSRDWLMWFIYSVISSYPNRNYIYELVDLFELLYSIEEDCLPAPSLSSFECVVKLAPISVWIFLNSKLSSQSDSSSLSASGQNKILNSLTKTLIKPELLRNHLSLLHDCIQNQRFNDYAFSVCMNAYCTETSVFNTLFNHLLDKIGKSNLNQTAPALVDFVSNLPNVFTSHQALPFDTISSLAVFARVNIITYLTYLLTQKTNVSKALTLNIPAAIVETFARFMIYDPDNSMKFFSQNVWQFFIAANLNQIALPINLGQQQQQIQLIQMQFLYQQMNMLIELVGFRLKHLSFTHKTTFLLSLNNLFTSGAQASNSSTSAQQQSQQGQQQSQQSQTQQSQSTQQRTDSMNFTKHPQIYLNAHCAMLKLLSSFNGSDYYELLNSITASSKHAPKYFINPESEEINKAIVLLIARAVHLTTSDLSPMENKERDESLRYLLREIVKTTPIYFHDYVLNHFPKLIQEFFLKEQSQLRQELIYTDSSNKTYKLYLKKKVDEDYKRFLECRHETQVQSIFQNNPINVHTLLCIFFNLLQDDSVRPNFSTYLSFILSYLNSSENRKVTQAMRTFCDYLLIESANKSMSIIEGYVAQIIKMINIYNIFTYDRFLFIISFRSFDQSDLQLMYQILNLLFVQNPDFQSKFNDFFNLWNANCPSNSIDEWNPTFYSQYISMHPDKLFYEGIKEQLNIQSTDSHMCINTYYGSMILRCVPILDYLNNRYLEMKQSTSSNDAESLLDTLNHLYKFHNNPIAYVYNSLVYYNSKFEQFYTTFDMTLRFKKRRLLNILINQSNQFSSVFQSFLANQQQTSDISTQIDTAYFHNLLKKLVNRMLDKDLDHVETYIAYKSEFPNPSCQMMYASICEMIFLELFVSNDFSRQFSKTICTNLISVLLYGFNPTSEYQINRKELLYWTSAAGILIANLPDTFWHPIYELLSEIMKTDELLNYNQEPTEERNLAFLLDNFDFYLANNKNCFNKLTMLLTLFHSIWCHSSANHFQYFTSFLKENQERLVVTESHFLFVCKLIGPFLSKIHFENSNLLIELVGILYEMIHRVDKINSNLYYMETICNFFYHLKYRHIGESIKEKIHSLMPGFRPQLKNLFKYITSELNQQLQQQQQQQQQQQKAQALMH